MIRGLVIGKFYPPHRGHQYLIEVALAQVDWLDVLVCVRADETISGEQRVAWLREMHPTAHVRQVEDIRDDENSAHWATYTLGNLPQAPDVVFTSEEYGPEYARLLGARHIMVDHGRHSVPVSGTEIRRAPLANLHFLAPCVRAHYVKRVCLVGAESTGTTTLAQALAAHYGTQWVPEFGREYTEIKCGTVGDMSAIRWTTPDFIEIARTQIACEDDAARNANRVLFCDTDALATAIWHERYMGARCRQVEEMSAARHYDLYLLTDCEIPFVQDGLRDGEHIRQWMTNRFRQELEKRNAPWALIRGNREKRLSDAIALVDPLLG